MKYILLILTLFLSNCASPKQRALNTINKGIWYDIYLKDRVLYEHYPACKDSEDVYQCLIDKIRHELELIHIKYGENLPYSQIKKKQDFVKEH